MDKIIETMLEKYLNVKSSFDFEQSGIPFRLEKSNTTDTRGNKWTKLSIKCYNTTIFERIQ